MSNGSIIFTHKTCDNFRIPAFLEKDAKNFTLNMKSVDSKTNLGNFLGYRNKYLKNK